MFSISQFKSNVKIVRPNLFRAKVTKLPSFLSTQFNTSTFEYRCEATELPGKTIATTDESGIGTTVKLPYDVTYNDINFQIIASEDMMERRMFETWIDNIVYPNSPSNKGGLIRYYDSYLGTFTVDQFNDSGLTLVRYTLHNAYPIQLSPMNLSWEESNSYQRFTVTVAYRYHTYEYIPEAFSAGVGPQLPSPGILTA